MKAISCRFTEDVYIKLKNIMNDDDRKSLNNVVNVLVKEALKKREKLNK